MNCIPYNIVKVDNITNNRNMHFSIVGKQYYNADFDVWTIVWNHVLGFSEVSVFKYILPVLKIKKQLTW